MPFTIWNLSKVDVNVDIDNVDVDVHRRAEVLLGAALMVGHQVPASVFAHISSLCRLPSVKCDVKVQYTKVSRKTDLVNMPLFWS